MVLYGFGNFRLSHIRTSQLFLIKNHYKQIVWKNFVYLVLTYNLQYNSNSINFVPTFTLFQNLNYLFSKISDHFKKVL